jgi:uncharacterized protein
MPNLQVDAMPSENQPCAFSDADLERLEAILGAPPLREAALTADAMQGLFVAMSMGPDESPAERWLEAALGVAAQGESTSANAELIDLLTRFRDDTAARVHDGTLSLLLYTLRRGRPDFATWCQGFLLGVDLSQAGWYDSADPDDVDELLFPIHVLADQLTPEERASYTPAAWRKLVLDAEAGFDQSLQRLRDYWAILRTPPATVRHAGPKPGRNDPCPCGSGRKFKQCCGR